MYVDHVVPSLHGSYLTIEFGIMGLGNKYFLGASVSAFFSSSFDILINISGIFCAA
jgi:hypothetical protein